MGSTKLYTAKVNINASGKRFIAGQQYTEKEIEGLNFNNFLFEGNERVELKQPVVRKQKAVKAKPKPRGRPKRK